MEIDFLADTNVLINLAEGDRRLVPYVGKLFAVSFVTEIEFLGVKDITRAELNTSQAIIDDCVPITCTNEIKERAIHLMQAVKLKVPDALIAATGLEHKLTVLTFDRDFLKIPGIKLQLLR